MISTASANEVIVQLQATLEETRSLLEAAEDCKQKLLKSIAEMERDNKNALDQLQQELEHKARVEHETLESEFESQVAFKLKHQAAELESHFVALNVTEDVSTLDQDLWFTGADKICEPDSPHTGTQVESTLMTVVSMFSGLQSCALPKDCNSLDVLNPDFGMDLPDKLFSTLCQTCCSSSSVDNFVKSDCKCHVCILNSWPPQKAAQSTTEERLSDLRDQFDAEVQCLAQNHDVCVGNLQTQLNVALEKCEMPMKGEMSIEDNVTCTVSVK